MSTPNLDTRYAKPSDITAAINSQATSNSSQYLTYDGSNVLKNGSAITVPSTSPVNIPVASSILFAGLAKRNTAACNIVFTGSSTTAGTAATDVAHRYVNLLSARIQAAYPSSAGTEAAVVSDIGASWGTISTALGVHVYNGGEGGTTSSTYMTDTEASNIAALSPIAVFHMIGSNDYYNNVDPATYKANVLGRVTKIKSLMSTVCVHVLIQAYQRWDVTGTYAWSNYGAAIKSIADADPTRVMYVDLSPYYAQIGIPASDPLGLVTSDHVHQNNDGHAFMADLLYRTLGFAAAPAVAPAGTSTPALTNSTAPAITGTNSVGNVLTASNGSWSATPDSYTYQWTRGGTAISSATGQTYTLVSADAGQTINITVTAIKSGYTNGVASAASVTITGGSTGTVTDSFGRSDGELVGSSTESGSKTWAGVTAQTGAAYVAGDVLIQTGAVGAKSGGVALNRLVYVSMGSADMTVQCKLTAIGSGSTNQGGGLAARVGTDGTCLWLSTRINSSTVGYSLYSFSSSSSTLLAQVSQTPAIGDILKIICSGTTVTGYINGTQVMQATNVTASQTSTGAGLLVSAAGTASRYDDFSASN